MLSRHRATVIVVSALAVPLAIVGAAWGMHESRQAEAEEHAAAQRDAARTAVVQLIDDGAAVRAELGDRIDEGQETAAAGKTAKKGVLQALEETLSTAESHVEAPVPEVPAQDATAGSIAEARTEVEVWADGLEWMSGELARNIRAAEASQQEYRRAQAEKKTRAEKKARAAKERERAEASSITPEVLDQAVTDLEPLIEDAGFTVQWSEQVAVPADTLERLRARLAGAERAVAEAKSLLAGDPGRGDVAVGQAHRATVDAFDTLEEASWQARDAGADGSNGRISRDQLCLVSRSPEGLKQYLRCDAADAWERLGAAFEQEFGESLQAEYGYRAYDLQLWAMAVYGAGQAAQPGTSDHGWGQAIDLPEGDAWRFGGAYYEWLRANGPGYGWDNPAWARQGNGREEPWHFEFETTPG
ncbi:hypothetical protein GCM10028784_34700 [Myceligenerans cantabricum]